MAADADHVHVEVPQSPTNFDKQTVAKQTEPDDDSAQGSIRSRDRAAPPPPPPPLSEIGTSRTPTVNQPVVDLPPDESRSMAAAAASSDSSTELRASPLKRKGTSHTVDGDNRDAQATGYALAKERKLKSFVESRPNATTAQKVEGDDEDENEAKSGKRCTGDISGGSVRLGTSSLKTGGSPAMLPKQQPGTPERHAAERAPSKTISHDSTNVCQPLLVRTSCLKKKDPVRGGPVARSRKAVRFGKTTIYHFERRQGSCGVPTQGGCSLGMSWTHHDVEEYDLDSVDVRKNRPFAGDVSSNAVPYPIPSYQRRELLRNSGVSVIDLSEFTECEKIRTSRENCGCSCVVYCEPAACFCAIHGIPCQAGWPEISCMCAVDACENPNGRHEFDAITVREHVLRTCERANRELGIHSEHPSVGLRSWNDVLTNELSDDINNSDTVNSKAGLPCDNIRQTLPRSYTSVDLVSRPLRLNTPKMKPNRRDISNQTQ